VRSLRKSCTGRWPVHSSKRGGVLAAAAIAAVVGFLAPAPAYAGTAAVAPAAVVPVAVRAQSSVGQSVADFYKARKGAPLWLSPTAGDAAQQLLSLLSTATIDGLNPDKYHLSAVEGALEAARNGKRKSVERADEALSEAFVAYVEDLRQDPGVGISYVDPQLKPISPSPLAALLEAAATPSLSNYVVSFGWMHPIYGALREALAEHKYSDDHERAVLEVNLRRARALPAGGERYVLVNAAQQRLYMYQGRKPVDSMVVVVGKPKWPTPMLTAYIRYAALNPYWYVPPDLAPEDVAQYVVKFGLKYLDDYGYEVVSDWTSKPTIIDPKTIDWKAVNDGKVQINIRQRPGPKNFMGRIKFMFPNNFGVYLHDNPRRELFEKSSRYFSGGCVRLEDAWRLSRWLFGRELTWEGAGPEQPVPLALPVPVYITYLTAVPDGRSVAYYDDAYGRDKAQLAVSQSVSSSSAVASR
jgi:L,D-transpeptidase YcbB